MVPYFMQINIIPHSPPSSPSFSSSSLLFPPCLHPFSSLLTFIPSLPSSPSSLLFPPRLHPFSSLLTFIPSLPSSPSSLLFPPRLHPFSSLLAFIPSLPSSPSSLLFPPHLHPPLILPSSSSHLTLICPLMCSDSMTAYIMVVLAGLAGSPRMASATLQALARLLYDFHGKGCGLQ